MSVSLAMAIAIAKKYSSNSGDITEIREEIREEVKAIYNDLNTKINDVEITPTGINFKANESTVQTLEFVTEQDVSNIINNLQK